jgi:tRNA dimethylallyltransferase
MSSPFHRALYLTGPTACGKTAVGVALAERLGAEVVAMDSMTLYRGLDIGTAKPTREERRDVPHHLLDVIDPWDAASVADYLGWAEEAVREIEGRGRRVLFVGGTALYLKAALRGLFEGPPADPALREAFEMEDSAALHERLKACDPAAAVRLPKGDRRRVIRALEVFAATGRTISSFHETHDRPAEGVGVFALERPREEVHTRINRRVVAMFDAGLLDEVRRVMSGPRPLNQVPAQGVGYREAIAHLGGELSRDEAIARTQARTRQFAKRQGTWFRGLAECRPFPIVPGESAEETAGRILECVSA